MSGIQRERNALIFLMLVIGALFVALFGINVAWLGVLFLGAVAPIGMLQQIDLDTVEFRD